MTRNINDQFGLSIDKLSAIFNDHDKNRIQRTGDRLIEMVKSGQLANAKLRSGQRHKLQCEIPVAGLNQTLVLQIGGRHQDIASYRLEYNPSKVGQYGRYRVRNILDSVFEFGGYHLLMAGKITRIDAALDLNNLSVDEVLVRQKRMRKFTVISIGGCPRSLYHGSSNSNQAAIYDKSDAGVRVLRIEKRLKPNCLGGDLPLLNNPFGMIQLVPINLLIPVLNGLNLQHLCDSIRMRGFPHVLKSLPSRQRKAIEGVLDDPRGSLLPPPDLIWNRWPALLAECDLLSEIGFAEAAE